MKFFRAILILISLFAFFCEGHSQDIIHDFPGKFDFAKSDPLGSFYLVNETQIIKIDSLGKLLYNYSNPDLGSITDIDSSDPFRILVYYQSYNQLLFLDRTLTPIGDPVKLDDLEVFSLVGICQSGKGGLWILDAAGSSILYFDNKLRKQLDIRISGFFTGNENEWLPMLEWKERLYICKRKMSVSQFDLFGTQLKTIPVKAHDICLLENNILFTNRDKAFLYQSFPPYLSDALKFNISSWENLVVSKNIALVKDQSGWHLKRLKKTL